MINKTENTVPYTPDMPTQVKLFVLRSRARTADIDRRPMLNQTMDLEANQRHRVSALGWKACLLREGPRQAEEIMQLWCLLQAKRCAFEELSEDQDLVDEHLKSLSVDEDFKSSIDKWFESAVFHDTIRSTQYKGVSNKSPPLLLNASEYFQQGRDRAVAILTQELKFDAETGYEYMRLSSQLEAQAKRNRETHLRYGKGLWFDQVSYSRAVKSIAEAEGDDGILLRFDQAVYAAYERAIAQPSLADTMVRAFAAVCAHTPYGAEVFVE